jgi:pimeloyl-ACP methyl ester carboxylesterase
MRVIPNLVPTHRVVAPDLPGHGASGVPDAAFDAEWPTTWLGELIDKACKSPPVVVGHGLGGAIAARFAVGHSNAISRLVLVDSLGLGPFEPASSFGLALNSFLEHPTGPTRDALFAQCFHNVDALREEMGDRWSTIADYALDRVRAPSMQPALASLMPHVGFSPIAAAELARIAGPVTLIWGRHDLQVRLRVAEAASARHGWPLHVIDNAGDDPALEQPGAFLTALRAALETAHVSEVTG